MADLRDNRYMVDSDIICKVRLLENAELRKIYGTQTTTPVSHDFTIKLSKNSNQFGITPRSVIMEATSTPTNATRSLKATMELPVLTEAHWNSIVTTGDNVTKISYGGLSWSAKKKKEQSFK